MDIILVSTARGDSVNPNITDALDQLEGSFWPGEISEAAHPALLDQVTNHPILSHPRSLEMIPVGSFFDDFYNHIYLIPIRIDTGVVVHEQQYQITIWNAYLDQRTLQRIYGLPDGITIDPTDPDFMPLEERELTVNISPDGPTRIDNPIYFEFDTETPILIIIGSRAVPFLFIPNWSNGIAEQLSWATDIMRSESGREQRRALRVDPRRAFNCAFILDGDERRRFDMWLLGRATVQSVFPIYPGIQWLSAPVAAGSLFVPCDTSDPDLQTGTLLIFRGTQSTEYELVEINAVQADGVSITMPLERDWRAGTRLYPGRVGILSNPMAGSVLKTDDLSVVDLQFMVTEPDLRPIPEPAAVYRERPVLEIAPDWSKDITSAMQRILQTFDAGQGYPVYEDVAGQVFPTQTHAWNHFDKATYWSFKDLLAWLCGRQDELWVPTFADDLTLAVPVAAGSNLMTIRNVGYAQYGAARPNRRDIRIRLRSGETIYRRIVNSEQLDSNQERLELDVSLPGRITPTDVSRISWMMCARLDADTVEITHLTDSVSQSEITFKGVKDV